MGRLRLKRMRQALRSQFFFDGRRQGVDSFPGRLIEFAIHKFDIEMPLNLKNELEDINGVDPQIPTKQRFIIPQALWTPVRDPQALNND